MLKFLLFAGLIAAVYFLFFKKTTLSAPKNDASQDEAMIPCAKCGTYVQVKETFIRDGKYYCSHECLEA